VCNALLSKRNEIDCHLLIDSAVLWTAKAELCLAMDGLDHDWASTGRLTGNGMFVFLDELLRYVV
jgi:hypothetical protein